MSRDPTLYLHDIEESCQKIRSYTHGMTFVAFAADAKTIDAVARNLEVIGEAVKRLPAEWKRTHADVEWRKIGGLRNMLIHAYFGLDMGDLVGRGPEQGAGVTRAGAEDPQRPALAILARLGASRGHCLQGHASGSGTSVQEISKLLKQYKQMQLMMKRVKKMGGTKQFLARGLPQDLAQGLLPR